MVLLVILSAPTASSDSRLGTLQILVSAFGLSHRLRRLHGSKLSARQLASRILVGTLFVVVWPPTTSLPASLCPSSSAPGAGRARQCSCTWLSPSSTSVKASSTLWQTPTQTLTLRLVCEENSLSSFGSPPVLLSPLAPLLLSCSGWHRSIPDPQAPSGGLLEVMVWTFSLLMSQIFYGSHLQCSQIQRIPQSQSQFWSHCDPDLHGSIWMSRHVFLTFMVIGILIAASTLVSFVQALMLRVISAIFG